MKQCKQCGEFKPIETGFRKYYGGRKGHYTICKDCEKVNTRFKYMIKKNNLSEAQVLELKMIKDLFELQRSLGFSPPALEDNEGNREAKTRIVQSLVDSMTTSMRERVQAKLAVIPPDMQGKIDPATPQELLDWLTKDLAPWTPEQLDDIYSNHLNPTYRPQMKLDENMNPVYDNRFRDVLIEILKRFEDYEDNYEDPN